MHSRKYLCIFQGSHIFRHHLCFLNSSSSSVSEKLRRHHVDGKRWPEYARKDPADRFGTLSFRAVEPTRIRAKNDIKLNERVDELSTEDNMDIPSRSLLNFEKKRAKNIDLPVINEPVSVTKKMTKKFEREKELLKEFEEKFGVDRSKAKLIIDCARKEFYHYAGMRYPPYAIPLISDSWTSNKSKNDWFIIRKDRKNPSFDLNRVFSWDECMGLIDDFVIENLIRLGFKRPTVIQMDSFQAFDNNELHIFIAAETGSGKTIAYAAPLLKKITERKKQGKNPKGTILVPSKILAAQVTRMISSLIDGTDIRLHCINKDSVNDSEEWDLVVSTPGLFARYVQRNALSSLDFLVFDEADILLDDSFVNEMCEILSRVRIQYPANGEADRDGARVIFCSAVCPDELINLAGEVVNIDCLQILRTSQVHCLVSHVEQTFKRVREMDKIEILKEILEKEMEKGRGQIAIFGKDLKTCLFIRGHLKGYQVQSILIGGVIKDEQMKMINSLHAEKQRIIVGTDLFARGLDLPLLSHVINYDFPRHMSDYIHRVGRVGRINSKFHSRVTSFVRCPWEIQLVQRIEHAARSDRPIEGIETNIAGMLAKRKEKGFGKTE